MIAVAVKLLRCYHRSLSMLPATPVPDLSIVIPCFNEAAVLPLLKSRLLATLGGQALAWEVVLVDDGSSDNTLEQLEAMHREDARFRILSFSRNFGHQAAISAGLAHATGRMVAVMDADLQDPPEILPTCIDLVGQGYDVVYAVRKKRKESLAKRAAYQLFYRLLKAVSEVEIPLDAGDFCVMSRRVVDLLNSMPERNVFVRGLRAWAGFRQIGLEYERAARAAGETKYPFAKLWRLATDGVFSLSTAPLRLAAYFGFFAVGCSVAAGMFILLWRTIGFRFMGHTATELPGWAAIIAAMLFLSGIQLLILGFVGEYIGRIYAEVKQRPRWVIRRSLGLAATTTGREEKL